MAIAPWAPIATDWAAVAELSQDVAEVLLAKIAARGDGRNQSPHSLVRCILAPAAPPDNCRKRNAPSKRQITHVCADVGDRVTMYGSGFVGMGTLIGGAFGQGGSLQIEQSVPEKPVSQRHIARPQSYTPFPEPAGTLLSSTSSSWSKDSAKRIHRSRACAVPPAKQTQPMRRYRGQYCDLKVSYLSVGPRPQPQARVLKPSFSAR